jgi:hypothetical protein
MSPPQITPELNAILKLGGSVLEAITFRGKTVDFVLRDGRALRCFYIVTLQNPQGWRHDYEIADEPHQAFYFHRLLGEKIGAVVAQDHRLTVEFETHHLIIHSRRNLRNPDDPANTDEFGGVWPDVELTPISAEG